MKKYYFFLLTCIMISWLNSHGQSFYHIQYDSTTVAQQDGFLIIYDDGTGLLRNRTMNNETGKPLISEFLLEERYLTATDGTPIDNLKYYETRSSRNVIGNGPKPSPVRIWVRLNETNGFFEPWAAGPGATAPEKNITAGLLESEALKKNVVLNYFSQYEDLYKTLFATRVRGLTPAEKKIKLHLLVVANTNDKSIGSSCRFDMLRMIETFTDLTDYLGIGFSLDTIAGNSYNKKAVMNAVEKLKGSTVDIIVFYYSGHGFRKPADKRKFPYLELRGKGEKDFMTNSVNIEDVYNSLQANKKARLKLVISDCCNSEVEATNTQGKPISGTKGSGIAWNEANIKQLFFNSRKSILVTSADIGQLAAGNNTFGGFFSYYFKSSMENHFSIFKNNVTWEQVLTDAKKQTIKKAENTCCQKPCSTATACKQTPGYIIR